MPTTIVDIGTLIIRTPDVCGDRPRIADTSVTVGRIATLWKSGQNAEEIAREIEHLSLAQVYAALTYYHANREEIDQILARDDADYERLMALHYSDKEPK
jgi:uncharacterized protein (DUF433 family)